MQNVSNGETTRISVSKAYLPGEFVLRFDYKEKETSTPYPAEKYFFINDQDLELWVNPLYSNNKDSTRFQQNERENSAFTRFSEENGRRKVKLGLLQNFLMNYDDTKSQFYSKASRNMSCVANLTINGSPIVLKKIRPYLSVTCTLLSMSRKSPGQARRLTG